MMFQTYRLAILAFALVFMGAGCLPVHVTFGNQDDELSTSSEEAMMESEMDTDSEIEAETELDYEVPEGLLSVVEAPARVAVGDTVDVTLTITNDTAVEQFLHSIDIGESYLAGLALRSMTPAFTDSFPLTDGTVTHFIETPVTADGDTEVVLTFEALTEGDYSGDFDVCFKEGFTCSYLRIRTLVE